MIVGCSLSKIELSIQCSALASNGPGEEHLTSKDILAVSWPYENVLPGTWRLRLGEAGSGGKRLMEERGADTDSLAAFVRPQGLACDAKGQRFLVSAHRQPAAAVDC